VNSSAKVQALCKLVSLNNDPYPALSLMSGMGLGLAAVTSSLRLFSNKAVFKRESRSGMSTEAHYVGPNAACICSSALRPRFCSQSTLYWLVAPRCSFASNVWSVSAHLFDVLGAWILDFDSAVTFLVGNHWNLGSLVVCAVWRLPV
jgi:hypothetical protein